MAATKKKKPAQTIENVWPPEDRRAAATFGAPRGAYKQAPDEFLRSHVGLTRKSKHGGERAPKQTRKAALDMSSPALAGECGTDFLRQNALQAIRAIPPAIGGSEADMLAKPDYGRVPQYLTRRRAEMQQAREEKAAQATLRAQQAQDAVMTRLAPEEKEALTRQLKERWGALNAAFQKLPLQLDTPTKLRRKEQLEAELAQTEADIVLLQHHDTVMVMHA